MIRVKRLRKETCSVCGGEGFVPFERGFYGKPISWTECPVCEGVGEVYPVYEEPHLWTEDLRPRPSFVEEELREWVRVYREARGKAKLPPEEAARVANLAVYGPLPF